jgi:hypothetical protein
MSDRERPLHHDISLGAMVFASELARYQRSCADEIERIRACEWQSGHESDAEYRRRVDVYLLDSSLHFLRRGRYLARNLDGVSTLYFDDRIRRLDPPESEPQNDGH